MRGNTQNFYEWLEAAKRANMPEGPAGWISGDCHLGSGGEPKGYESAFTPKAQGETTDTRAEIPRIVASVIRGGRAILEAFGDERIEESSRLFLAFGR